MENLLKKILILLVAILPSLSINIEEETGILKSLVESTEDDKKIIRVINCSTEPYENLNQNLKDNLEKDG